VCVSLCVYTCQCTHHHSLVAGEDGDGRAEGCKLNECVCVCVYVCTSTHCKSPVASEDWMGRRRAVSCICVCVCSCVCVCVYMYTPPLTCGQRESGEGVRGL